MKKPTVYVALPLTHVKDETDRQRIRDLLMWIREQFDVELLMWAFDPVEWVPIPVPNIYAFDNEYKVEKNTDVITLERSKTITQLGETTKTRGLYQTS